MLKYMGYATDDIQGLVINRARLAMDIGCHGVVCSGHEVKKIKQSFGDSCIAVVPGIRPNWAVAKDDQKRIVTPADAIKSGADYIVVGRPIRDAKDPKAAAVKIAKEIEEATINS